MDERGPATAWDGIPLNRLTPRELEILRAMTAGNSTNDIATDLDISRLTVQSHVKSILVKLGVHSKVEAVVLGLRHGLSTDG
jgi:two-component system nitrate/nitrite response regulator NarL